MITTTRLRNLTTEALNGFLREPNGRLDPTDTIRLLRENKYPLLSLDLDSLPEELSSSPEFQQALVEDQDWLDTQRSHYLLVRDEWLKRGIPHIFIKTACVAPSFPYSSDNLDILVPWESALEALNVVRSMGFIEIRNTEEQNKFLFRKFINGKSVCALHVHRWIGWNTNFFEQDTMWDRARVSPDDEFVLAPSPEDALLINLAHAYYENKRFALHDMEKMRVNWLEHDLDWDYLHEVPQRSGWYDGFLMGMLVAAHLEEKLTGATTIPQEELQRIDRSLRRFPDVYRHYEKLLKGTVSMPFRFSFLYSKLLYYRKIRRDTHDSVWQKGINTFRTLVWGFRLRSGFRPNRGMVVAISGMDGSGKTLQAKDLCRHLTFCEVPNTYYWNRISYSPLTRLLSRLMSRSPRGAATNGTTFGEDQTDLSHRSSFVQSAWAWFVVLDLVARYAVRVRVPMLRGYIGLGKVVVCDRFGLDAAAEILIRIPSPGWGVRSALSFLKAFCPRPRLSFLLDVPEDVAQDRHELSLDLELLGQNRERYLELSTRFGAQIQNGLESPSELGDKLQSDVLRDFEATHPNWVNWLLLYNPNQLNPGMSPEGK